MITTDDRLETVARDIVYHFPRRGYLGKGLVIAVDKFTAVTMFEKVQARWFWKAWNMRWHVAQKFIAKLLAEAQLPTHTTLQLLIPMGWVQKM